jgi:hypothetical protein
VEIRKLFTVVEDIYSEMGKKDGDPLRKVGVVAVVKNPYAGKYQQDLQYLIDQSKEIGRIISSKAVEAMGNYPVQSYGKGAVVGLDGEQEHGVAMITTVFGNILREAVGGGKAWISSMTKRSAPGVTIDIPLAYKDALYVRSHYDGMTLTLYDAPLPDEIAVICVVANRGRLNARVGGLRVDQVKGEDGLT